MAGLRSDLNDLRRDLRQPVVATPQSQRSNRREPVDEGPSTGSSRFTGNAHHEDFHMDNGEGSSTNLPPGRVEIQVSPRRIWNKRSKRSAEKNAFNVSPSYDYYARQYLTFKSM